MNNYAELAEFLKEMENFGLLPKLKEARVGNISFSLFETKQEQVSLKTNNTNINAADIELEIKKQLEELDFAASG